MNNSPSPDVSHRAFLDATLPHVDAVWNVARRLAPDHAAAEDLAQETFLLAFRGFGGQDGGAVRPWLVAICVNAARSQHRRSTRRPQVVREPSDSDVARSGSGDDPARAAMAALDRATVAQALAALPEQQRVAIVMMDLAGLTARETAESLGVPRGTVLSRVHRGRRDLAAILDREGLRRGP